MGKELFNRKPRYWARTRKRQRWRKRNKRKHTEFDFFEAAFPQKKRTWKDDPVYYSRSGFSLEGIETLVKKESLR